MTFNQGACGVETATTDLGFTKADVTAAFTSVGVSCATTPPAGRHKLRPSEGLLHVLGRQPDRQLHGWRWLHPDLQQHHRYNIHNRTGSGTDNITKTVTLNLSTELLNGTWKLRVNDNAAGDTGYINNCGACPFVTRCVTGRKRARSGPGPRNET